VTIDISEVVPRIDVFMTFFLDITFSCSAVKIGIIDLNGFEEGIYVTLEFISYY